MDFYSFDTMLQRVGAIGLFFGAVVLVYFFPLESWGVLLACVALWLFFLSQQTGSKTYPYMMLRYSVLQDSVYAKEISLSVALGVLSKVRIFPLLFGIYLLYLFIGQTQLFALHFSWFFLFFNEGLHLFLLLISVYLMSAVDDKTYEKYVVPVHSRLREICCVTLVGVLACLSVWIVWEATGSLGLISHLISGLTGWCVVLLGFLLIGAGEEDNAG